MTAATPFIETACAIALGSPTLRPAGSTGDGPHDRAQPTTVAPVQSGPAAVVGKGEFPDPFPAELELLAAARAEDVKNGSAFEWLGGLIARLEDDMQRADRPAAKVAAAMYDPLLDLRETIEGRIAGIARRLAFDEALQLDEQFADYDQEQAKTEFGFLTAPQRAALIWAQARALGAAMSLTAAAGGDR